MDRLYVTTVDFELSSLMTDSSVESEKGILRIFDQTDTGKFYHIRTNDIKLVLLMRSVVYDGVVHAFGTGFRVITYPSGK